MFKPVLKPEDVEHHILNYTPKPIHHRVPTQALPFLKDQRDATGSQFLISQMTAKNTGLLDLENKSFNDKIETQVLEKLKEIEEKAYADSFALGLVDGDKKAFAETSEAISQCLGHLHSLATDLTTIKMDLATKNETHLVRLVFHIAKALALKEIKEDEARIIPILKKAIEFAQSEEAITITLNPLDQDFLLKVKKDSAHPLERNSKVRIEISDAIAPGGCTVETNYGLIDATLEKRVEKLWSLLDAKIPKGHEQA